MHNNSRNKNTNISKQISAIILALCVVLFVLTTFNFVFVVKAFLLGAFGFTIYPVLLFTSLFCFLILKGQKFIYSPKYLVFLFLCFFFLVCVLQIVFTGFNATEFSYGQYLSNCFNGLYTPGGVLVGVFVYPIFKLLHPVAGIVFFAIALIISIYFVLSYLQGVRDRKFVQEEEKNNKYKNFESFSSEINAPKEVEQEASNLNVNRDFEVLENKNLQEDDDEDNIFIEDQDKKIAKEKLGLTPENVSKNENKENFTASEKLFGNNYEENEVWQNRASVDRSLPQKFEGKQVKKENPIYEKNKEYLKTLYQINNDSSNPIINAEDYEDYKEKMKFYEDSNRAPFKRDLDVNQTLTPSNKDVNNNVEDENLASKDFGIEPYKKFANDRGGFDNFDSLNYKRRNNNESLNVYKTENLEDKTKNYGEDENYSSGNIEGIDDYIKPLGGFDSVRKSPLNPFNFEVSNNEVVKDDGIKSGTENNFKPFDTTKPSSEDVGSSLGNTVNLKEQPSNVYKLPQGFNGGNFESSEMIASQKEKKNNEPKFAYNSKYIRPPVNLLERYINEEDLTTDHQKNIEILERVLEEFKIPAKVEAVRRGSAVTRYELHMPVGIPVRKIHQHASDIALALASPGEIRIETPIKGKSAVGIEVPNKVIDKVGFRDIIESSTFQEAKKTLTFALGKDIDGTIYCCDLASMPHLLVAGSTGSGKSVCLNALILSLIYRTSPEDLRFILVDPKRVEFAIFNNLPHLLMPKAITEPKKALNALDWLVNEMERRYTLFQECYVKNISEYNAQPEVISKKIDKLPFIVLIVDEFADLVLTTNRKELEEKIMRLTQKARAAGIHVILATQRPNAEIITGSIKINLPSRIAFAVTSYIDSKVILDQPGAEKLLGRGDMLYSPQSSEPVRIQGCFVDTPEVKRVVEFVKEHNACFYDENVENAINSENGPNGGSNGGNDANSNGGGEFDSLMPDALKLVIENGQATISMLQRRFAIGFSRAARIIDQMETAKFISGSDGSKPRNVYITMEDYEKLYGG